MHFNLFGRTSARDFVPYLCHLNLLTVRRIAPTRMAHFLLLSRIHCAVLLYAHFLLPHPSVCAQDRPDLPAAIVHLASLSLPGLTIDTSAVRQQARQVIYIYIILSLPGLKIDTAAVRQERIRS